MKREQTSLQNILLMEDDPEVVEFMLKALDENGLATRVAVVENGEEALNYLYRRGKYEARAGGDPVAVWLNNKVPQVDGLEVLKAIKADERLKIVPVVVLTSSRETPPLVEFYKHGVNACVVKPADGTEFRRVIEHLGIFWGAINEPPPLHPG
ncbi:MAG: response regulator [Verrucomicrobia bacterium]|nr:response regulator [Verrucomicrobiota bacterium]